MAKIVISFKIVLYLPSDFTPTIDMKHLQFSDNVKGYTAQASVFGNMEGHLMIGPYDKNQSAAECISAVESGLEAILGSSEELSGFTPVFKRWFLSDASAQGDLIDMSGETPLSIIQQPPLNGSKAVLWVWLMKDVSRGYEYIFKGNMLSQESDSYGQMKRILEDYAASVRYDGLDFAENCVRTWIYVRDVDVNYAGIVKARKDLFDEWGLTADTHYIASTGINGLSENHRNLVIMDAYSVKGLEQKDIQYLHALENLSPTHIYGVTFERGTALHFEDRTQIMISGTASIDKNGVIVHPGDIERQTERTFENIGALLEEAKASFKDIAQMIVYIRDTADYRKVEKYVSDHFPDIPKVITWAPVCRPGWLVEVECIAYR